MIKRASLHIPYLIGFLIVIGLFLGSCAVPTDTSTQPTATVTPKTASSPGPTTKEPVTGPASQVKADSIKETDKKEDLKSEVSKPKRERLPDIPANHMGRTACIACHASGVSDIPKLPSDHTGRNDATCAACHKQLGVQPAPVKAPREKKDGMEVLPSDTPEGQSALPATQQVRAAQQNYHRTMQGGMMPPVLHAISYPALNLYLQIRQRQQRKPQLQQLKTTKARPKKRGRRVFPSTIRGGLPAQSVTKQV